MNIKRKIQEREGTKWDKTGEERIKHLAKPMKSLNQYTLDNKSKTLFGPWTNISTCLNKDSDQNRGNN